MERIFSIEELEGMIRAIKQNNPVHLKKVPKIACGKFLVPESGLIKHTHIGHLHYKTIPII